MQMELIKQEEEVKVHQLLLVFDYNTFSMVRSNILQMDPIPSIKKVYMMIITEEQHKQAAKLTDNQGEAVTFAAVKTETIKLQYTHCHKTGHDVLAWFQRIGYPEWWPDKGVSFDSSGAGHDCGVLGTAPSLVGWTGHATASRDDVHSVTTGITDSPTSSSSSVAPVGIPGLSEDQWSRLLNLLSSQNQKSSSNLDTLSGKMRHSWILDIDCSHYMTGCWELLAELHSIFPYAIGLPNGSEITGIQQGFAYLSPNFKIHHVLYIPKLKCNLISMSQLVKEHKCMVTIINEICVVQDRISRMLIGVGEQVDGIYFYSRLL